MEIEDKKKKYSDTYLYYKLVNITPIDKLSKKKIHYLSLSVNIAETSTFDSSRRMGSICIIGGKIFDAPNLIGTSTKKKQENESPSLHAEINVILTTLTRLKKISNQRTSLKSSILYVVRIMKRTDDMPNFRKFKLGMSKPCLYCQKTLFKYNIPKIFYTDIIDNLEVLCELKIFK